MNRIRWGSTLILASAAVVACTGPATEPQSTTATPEATTSTVMASSPSTTPTTEATTSTVMASSPSTTPQGAPTTSAAVTQSTEVLVFSRTEGFRHDSIDAGVDAIGELGDLGEYRVTATEDPEVFSSTGLDPFAVIVFLNTTGDVLDDSQQRAMEEFIRAGRGFVGIHSAADTEYDWEWYEGLVGAYFDKHPEPQKATVEVVASHPVVEGLPDQIERFDEWYDFRAHPGSGVTVLATVDESTYDGGGMGPEHPIAWAHEYEGGRAVFVGFGHTAESFGEPLVLTLLDNAIRWAGDLD